MKAGPHLPLRRSCINTFFSSLPKPSKSLGVSRGGCWMPAGPQAPMSLSTGMVQPCDLRRARSGTGKAGGFWSQPAARAMPRSQSCLGYACPKAAKGRTQAPPRALTPLLSLQRGFLGCGKPGRAAHTSGACQTQHGQPRRAAGSFFSLPLVLLPGTVYLVSDNVCSPCAPALSCRVFALGWWQFPSARAAARELVCPVPSFAPTRRARHACEEAAATSVPTEEVPSPRSRERAGIAPRPNKAPSVALPPMGAEAAPRGGEPASANNQPGGTDRSSTLPGCPEGKAAAGLAKGAGLAPLLGHPARGMPVRADNRGSNARCHAASWKFIQRQRCFLRVLSLPPGQRLSAGLVRQGRR